MQYSKINILDRPVIVDVKEGQFINTFLKTKEMPALQNFKQEATIKSVVCGAVLHNEGCEPVNHRQWLGYLFAYPHGEGYNLLSIVDIFLTPTMVGGGLTFTPFAALVESDIELNVPADGSITAFLRYEDMDIITNVLNRECVYAIKEIEPGKDIINSSNWKSSIDESHLLEIAFSIN